MGVKYAKSAFAARIFGVFRAKGTCLFAANVVLFLLNKIWKLKQMWLFLNLLYVSMWSHDKFYVIFLHFVSGTVLIPKHRLVTFAKFTKCWWHSVVRWHVLSARWLGTSLRLRRPRRPKRSWSLRNDGCSERCTNLSVMSIHWIVTPLYVASFHWCYVITLQGRMVS